MFGVNIFSEEYGDEATADFVVAGFPFSINASNLGLRLQTSRLLRTMMKSPLAIGTWIQATNA